MSIVNCGLMGNTVTPFLNSMVNMTDFLQVESSEWLTSASMMVELSSMVELEEGAGADPRGSSSLRKQPHEREACNADYPLTFPTHDI